MFSSCFWSNNLYEYNLSNYNDIALIILSNFPIGTEICCYADRNKMQEQDALY